MTDLEITRLCAEAMGLDWNKELARKEARFDGHWLHGYERPPFDPLHDDAQAMALDEVVLKAGYHISVTPASFSVGRPNELPIYRALGQMTLETMRRCRCECVAKMQESKQKERSNV